MKESRIKKSLDQLKGSKDGRTLVANFSYLTLLQIASYLFPFITLPYLARVIGVDGFGRISFAAAVIVWFQTIADWGFNYTATRDVAKNKDNKEKVSEIFSNVFWARCLLMLASFIVLSVCICLIPKLQANAAIILATFLMIPGHIMFPDWYFQAVERMKYITIFNIVIKSLFVAAIFIFIREPEDYIYQPIINSVGYILCGIVSMYIIIGRWGIRLRPSSFRQVFATIKASTDVFINNIFPNIYNAFSTLLLGFVGGPSANGMFDAGARFEKVVQQFLSVISRTFYPFLSRRIEKHDLYAKLNIGLSAAAFAVLFFGAPLIINLFYTEEFYGAVPVLRIMSFSVVFLALMNTYGTNYLIIQGHEKELRKITVICSVIGFFMAIVLVRQYSYTGAAITITATRGMLGIWSMIKACSLRDEPSGFRLKLLRMVGSRILPEKFYMKRLYRCLMGRKLDLENPKSFTEKLQWLKLYNRKPEYTVMVDKYAVKDYVSGIIGEEYVIPTLGVWDRPEDIDWDSLPDRFVLKTTSGGGGSGVVICRDRGSFDRQEAIRKLNYSLDRDIYRIYREWPYKDVPRRVIAEEYLEDSGGALDDYKFLCFGGEAKVLFIATDRFNPDEETKFDFFDMDFNHLPFSNRHPFATEPLKKPGKFDLMRSLAEKLAQGQPHIRVDFYEVNGKVYFGELTFYHNSGMVPIEPIEWDYKLGEWIKLEGK